MTESQASIPISGFASALCLRLEPGEVDLGQIPLGGIALRSLSLINCGSSLVKIGGNWCSWCYYLHDELESRPELQKLVAENYVVVNVNWDQQHHNEAVMAELRKYWPAAKPKPLISSFEIECLRTAHAVAPEFPRGYLIWGREDVDWLWEKRPEGIDLEQVGRMKRFLDRAGREGER